jgi:hypothetical protein
LPGSFRKMIQILNNSTYSGKGKRQRLRRLLNQATGSDMRSSKNEARIIFKMRRHLREDVILSNHPNSTCSFTFPLKMSSLDCERPVTPIACGSGHSEYGPELMFAHVFPKLNSPFKQKPISVTKVAVGGTQIYPRWMEENKDEQKNYWNALVDAIKGAKGTIEAFVWFQGESDHFVDGNSEERNYYLGNLTSFVAEVRNEIYDVAPPSKFISPEDIPVIIVELGRFIWKRGDEIISAQRAFVENDPNAVLVNTGVSDKKREQLSGYIHYNVASQLIIGERIAIAMAQILRARQRK